MTKNAFILNVTGHTVLPPRRSSTMFGTSPWFSLNHFLTWCIRNSVELCWHKQSICLLNSKCRPNSDVLCMCWCVLVPFIRRQYVLYNSFLLTVPLQLITSTRELGWGNGTSSEISQMVTCHDTQRIKICPLHLSCFGSGLILRHSYLYAQGGTGLEINIMINE